MTQPLVTALRYVGGLGSLAVIFNVATMQPVPDNQKSLLADCRQQLNLGKNCDSQGTVLHQQQLKADHKKMDAIGLGVLSAVALVASVAVASLHRKP
ncbi:MAG: hypothetical protein ACOYK8_07545 [Alphaproteobacteria bacterium]